MCEAMLLLKMCRKEYALRTSTSRYLVKKKKKISIGSLILSSTTKDVFVGRDDVDKTLFLLLLEAECICC